MEVSDSSLGYTQKKIIHLFFGMFHEIKNMQILCCMVIPLSKASQNTTFQLDMVAFWNGSIRKSVETYVYNI